MLKYCQMDRVHLQRSADGKVCLYVGIAGTSLAERVGKWHSEQKLTLSNLKPGGWLSTLRRTLLALTDFDYSDKGAQELNRFMDTFSVAWMPTASKGEAKAIESRELSGPFHYPLNIRDNPCQELAKYLSFLLGIRAAYNARYLPLEGRKLPRKSLAERGRAHCVRGRAHRAGGRTHEAEAKKMMFC